jgi:hypothetical protein
MRNTRAAEQPAGRRKGTTDSSVQLRGWLVALSYPDSVYLAVLYSTFACLDLVDRPRGCSFAVIGWLGHKDPWQS